jgi:signal transduction histidine kinase
MNELFAAAARVPVASVARRSLWPLLLVAGLAAESVIWRAGQSPQYVVYDLTVGFGAVFVSLLVWEARPANRIGPLLTSYSSWFLLSPVRFLPDTAWITLCWLVQAVLPGVFAHLILAYPSGRLKDTIDRGFVAGVYGYGLAMGVAQLLVAPAPELFGGCVGGPCPARPPFIEHARAAFTTLQSANNAVMAAVVAAFLVLVARHVTGAAGRERQRMVPIAVAAGVVAVNFVVESLFSADLTSPWDIPDLLDHGAQLVVALTFFWVLYSSRLERSHVADLLAQLSAAPPERLQPLLARLLRDPQLRLGRWDPDRQEYLDDAGRPLAHRSDSDRTVATRIDAADGPLGLLVHDASVLDDPRLAASVVAACGLALDNARLQGQLRARLAEVSASRARIVRAEDEARRRLERDLHDGAQQRLLGIGIGLQLARAQVAAGSPAADLIEESAKELRAAIDDLRDLAQGIHPTVLTDHGLAAALTALAGRIPLPVRISCDIGGRLPGSVESAAYFLICEALQNTVKHARATTATVRLIRADGRLSVQVADDGIGIDNSRPGSGLRGLADRVEALDGRLVVAGRPDGGTTVTADIPCG